MNNKSETTNPQLTEDPILSGIRAQTIDRLRMDYINSLPQPFMVRLCGDKIKWPIETIDVETGLMRIDVCGKLQPVHIGDAMEFVDADGNSHDPENFYSEYVEASCQKQ